MPFFSIIIPCYNRFAHLKKTVPAVLGQTYQDFELIIVNDGSTDNTEEYIVSLADKRIKYFKTENCERSHARNFGLSRATGRYINYFDSDDIMYAHRLQTVFNFINAKDSPDVLFTHYDFINEDGVIIGHTQRGNNSFTKDLLFNNFLAADAVFLKLKVAQQYLFLEEPRIITAEDWELWLRIHTEYEFVESNKRTFSMVVHQGRSLETISLERIQQRELFFVKHVTENSYFKAKYGRAIRLFVADRFTFLSLSLAIRGHVVESLKYLTRSFICSISVLMRKRFWGVIKTLIWKTGKEF